MIMSLRTALGLVAVPFALVSACAPELYKRDGIHPIHKRQNTPNRVEDSRGWSYDNHEDWNTLSESKFGTQSTATSTTDLPIRLGILLQRDPTNAHRI